MNINLMKRKSFLLSEGGSRGFGWRFYLRRKMIKLMKFLFLAMFVDKGFERLNVELEKMMTRTFAADKLCC